MDFFAKNLFVVIDEHDKRFYKDTATIEKMYSNNWIP